MDSKKIIKDAFSNYYKCLYENEKTMLNEDNASIETYKQRIDKVIKNFENISVDF